MADKIHSVRQNDDWASTLPSGFSIVIPVYNSADILPNLIERLIAVAKSLKMPFELILVNDGSRDRSWDVVKDLAEKHPWIRGIRDSCDLRKAVLVHAG